MYSLYEKSQQKLELDQVLNLLSQCADSSDGKQAALKITPTSDLEDALALLEETSAAVSMCTRKGNPYFGDISDIFTDEELRELYNVLDGFMIKESVVG